MNVLTTEIIEGSIYIRFAIFVIIDDGRAATFIFFNCHGRLPGEYGIRDSDGKAALDELEERCFEFLSVGRTEDGARLRNELNGNKPDLQGANGDDIELGATH